MDVIDDYGYTQMSVSSVSNKLNKLEEKINILAIQLDKVQKKLNVMDMDIQSLQGS